MVYSVGYTVPPKLLTLAQLDKRTDWYMLHPEFRRRLVALMDLGEGRVGFGGGWRSSITQETLFRSRYLPTTTKTGLYWSGSYWTKKPGVASAAPPGLSYHESTVDGLGVAADMIGDLDWLGVHAIKFKLHDFSHINNEPWHVQPTELPNGRREYNEDPSRWPLGEWVVTPDPVPPTPPVEDDMKIAILKPQGAYAIFLAETTQAGIALNVRWSGEGTAKVQSVIDAHVAAGAEVRSILISDLRNCFLLGPLPKGDPAYNWTIDDFAG